MFKFFIIAVFVFSYPVNAANNVIMAGPTIGFPQETSINVWWNLQSEETEHTIYYGETPYNLTKTKQIDVYTKTPSVTLNNLIPNTRYYYYVKSGKVTSDTYNFIVKKEDNMRFAIWADNQDGDAVFKKYTIPGIVSAKPDYLIGVGDLVQHGNNYAEWMTQLYGPAKKILSSIPFLPSRGNHDGESDLAKSMLPFPNNAGFYATIIGNTYIVSLDTNIDYSPGSSQYDWFLRVVTTSEWRSAKYRVVAFHKPPYANRWNKSFVLEARYDGEEGVRDYLVPIIEKSGTDIVLSGHSHCYEHGVRRNSNGMTTHYFIVGGGGGFIDTEVSGNWAHTEKTRSVHHVAFMDVTATNITMNIFNTVNGKIEDRVVVNGNRLDREHSDLIVKNGY